MADQKITELLENTTPDDADFFVIARSSPANYNKKISFANILSFISGLFSTADAATLASANANTAAQVVGLWDGRVSFDASTNTFPVTGGSGGGGAILKNDIFEINTVATAGSLFGYPVGTHIRARSDSPAANLAGWAVIQAGLGYAPPKPLSPTAVKTANYTAAPFDLIPIDTTSGSVVITLPTDPADKTIIAVKMVIQGAGNITTINTGGADVFNRAGGGTSATLVLSSQSMLFQYSTTGAIWYVISTDLPLGQLDARFNRIVEPTVVKTANYTAAPLDFVPVDTTAGNVTVTLPTAPANDTRITVKMIVQAGSNLVVIAAGGSDVFNVAGGNNTFTLSLLNQGVELQYKSSTAIWYVISDALVGSQVPTGAFVPFGGIAAPAGFLLCDGSAVSRATFASLFALLNPTLGVCTITIATPAVVSFTAHGMVAGDSVYLTTTGALPTGISANVEYFVIAAGITANNFEISATSGGAAINTSGTQSGVHTLHRTPYGLGDGTTTFNVPDTRQQFILGKAVSGTGSALGTNGGNIDHTHGSPLTTGAPSATVNATILAGGAASTTHTHSVTVPAANPPFLTANYIIKT